VHGENGRNISAPSHVKKECIVANTGYCRINKIKF
jgi:hypothetical protein